jgi:transcription antitermination factor NusG
MQNLERHLTDTEPRPGQFVKVIDGPYKSRYGVYINPGDEKYGRPITAVVRTRDDEDMGIIVRYDHLRPDVAGKR